MSMLAHSGPATLHPKDISPVTKLSFTDPQADRSWQGYLAMTFAQTTGKTQILQSQTQSPLKVQRPFYPEGNAVCHTVMVHTAGGMVGGDRLDYQLHLQPRAHALLTTAAAHKVYRSTGATAQQQVQVQVEAHGVLEWFPQETIVFQEACYRQNLHIDLAPDALWMGWDLTRFGRTARGERFERGQWRSHTEVWRQGQPLWIDRQVLEGTPSRLESPHGLAGYPVVGTFALVGCPVEPAIVEQARQLGADQNLAADLGVTRLLEGVLCRYRGASTQEARQWFTAVWRLLRLTYLERTACVPRVW